MDTPTGKPKVNEIDTIVMPEDVDYAAKAQDQGEALDEAVAWATKKGWQLRSVIWKEETDNGHVFVISYNKTAKAIPMSRRNKD
jgi:hypothetical protein